MMMSRSDDVCWAAKLDSSNLDFAACSIICPAHRSFMNLWGRFMSPSSLIDICEHQTYWSLMPTSWGGGCIVMTPCLWLISPIRDSKFVFCWPCSKTSSRLGPELLLRLKRFGCYRRMLEEATRTDRNEKGWTWRCVLDDAPILRQLKDARECSSKHENSLWTVAMTVDISRLSH